VSDEVVTGRRSCVRKRWHCALLLQGCVVTRLCGEHLYRVHARATPPSYPSTMNACKAALFPNQPAPFPPIPYRTSDYPNTASNVSETTACVAEFCQKWRERVGCGVNAAWPNERAGNRTGLRGDHPPRSRVSGINNEGSIFIGAIECAESFSDREVS